MGAEYTDMSNLFHHKFYSYEMECRKPDAIIYEKVLDVITSYSIHYTKLYDFSRPVRCKNSPRLVVTQITTKVITSGIYLLVVGYRF